MSFIEELKRRNVFRVGIAYVITSWLLAQIADLVLDNIESPDWVMQTLMLVLALGLPIALIFAWAFEITPEGIKKEKDVDRSQSITHHTGRKLDFAIIGILLIALSYFAWDKFAPSSDTVIPADAGIQSTAGELESAANTKSIAVLPFVNMSDDASNEYFSDGISEEILNSLAKVKELKVAGRTSSFAFKGQNEDLRKIGETLGVENILEGSVRKFGDQVRITAQLIQVDDGFHLWSESYDRKLENVFAIQDEIATAILKELKATLLEGEAESLVAKTTDARGYELYLLAKQRMYVREFLAIDAAAKMLDEAIAIDPTYAPAYAQRGIASLLLAVSSYGDVPDAQAYAQAKLYLDKALELDPNQAEAWAGRGLHATRPPARQEDGIAALQRALDLNPNLMDAANWLVLIYWSVNRMTEALALLEDMSSRDPLYKPAIGNRAFQLAAMGRGDEAMANLDAIEPFMKGDQQIAGSRAWVDFAAGRTASGLRHAQEALALQPKDRTNRVSVNQGHFDTHQYEKVIDDQFTDYYIWALFNMDRTEEAQIEARKWAEKNVFAALFNLLNASAQSDVLLQYFDERWPDLAAFQADVPANGLGGYREMTDLAYAFSRAGDQARFDQAMTILNESSLSSLEQGMRSGELLLVRAAYHTMAGEQEAALERLAQAIDGGLVVSTKISKQYPYFRELDGNPEYEAIQQRMIEHLNRERDKLGLEPVEV
jgi:TolB-like protein